MARLAHVPLERRLRGALLAERGGGHLRIGVRERGRRNEQRQECDA